MTELDIPKMTHNEMIDTLKEMVFGTFDRTTAREREALDEAIKVLEQEACEDAISRKAVLDTMSELNAISFYEAQEDSKECYHEIKKTIEAFPPVQPKAKVGKWISIYGNVKCSICGNVKDGRSVGKATHYCDFCGAKMESEVEE